MKEKNLQNIVDEIWPKIREQFSYPFISQPEVVSSLQKQNTAGFNFKDRKILISAQFIEELEPYLEKRKAIKAILQHETGHYSYFPRELSDHLYLLSLADQRFDQKAEAIIGFYEELPNELSILSKLGEKDVLELREVTAKKLEKEKETKSALLQKIIIGLYNELLGKKTKLGEEKDYVEKLKEINYLTDSIYVHARNMIKVGEIIKELISEEVDFGPSFGLPFGDITEIPKEAIEEALGDIILKHGKRTYEQVKRYLKKKGFKDELEEKIKKKDKSKFAGLERTDFQFNDQEIPFYIRWASQFGVYIAKRPIVKQKKALYRQGYKEYEVGDSITKTAIFASRGKIAIPGVSKIWLEEEGKKMIKAPAVPDLLIGLDSSGSMEHPRNKSYAVLAAFILARNYYRNDSKVGIFNFSSDLVYFPPSRDIDTVYSLACGYWGGGTVLNVEKLKEFIAKTQEGKIEFTKDEDYKLVLSRLSPEKRKKFLEKRIEIKNEKIKGKFERLDNILITDGYIYNLEETIAYLNSLGEITRNFIFLSNKKQYKEWSKLELPNTYIYLAEKPQDFSRLALGRAKTFAKEIHSLYWGE